MAPEKPREELYDMKADRHEINNLATSPQHRTVLERMRKALDEWQRETKDLGLVPELELRERMRPGGVWQRVSAPTITESTDGSSVKVKLASATDGASITYTIGSGEKPRWLLYTGEVVLKRPATLRARACRFGYLDSTEVMKSFDPAGK
jgi:N-sulfoglucosamine sulfohydrolase